MKEIDHSKQIRAAEEAEAGYNKAMRDALMPTTAEREAAERAELFMTRKERGSLSVYYIMFPDEKPRGRGDDAPEDTRRRGRGR